MEFSYIFSPVVQFYFFCRHQKKQFHKAQVRTTSEHFLKPILHSVCHADNRFANGQVSVSAPHGCGLVKAVEWSVCVPLQKCTSAVCDTNFRLRSICGVPRHAAALLICDALPVQCHFLFLKTLDLSTHFLFEISRFSQGEWNMEMVKCPQKTESKQNNVYSLCCADSRKWPRTHVDQGFLQALC